MTYAVEKKLVYIRTKNANAHARRSAIHAASLDYSSAYELNNNDKTALTIASRNSKSIYDMSCSLKSGIKNMSTMYSNIESQSKTIKNAIFQSKELQDNFRRSSWHIANSTNTLNDKLEHAHNKNLQLHKLLVELEDLSDMTTHLANKIHLERSYANPNPEVIDIITSKFGSYASDIRHSILKIKSISSELDRTYTKSKHDISNIESTLTTSNQISKDISTNLDILNNKYNHILVDTTALKNILANLDITSKRITADSNELLTITNMLGKVSYSISKLN